MKKIFTLAALLCATASAMAEKPPACGSEETRTNFIRIVRDQVVPGKRYQNTPLNVYLATIVLENAAPISYDKSIEKFECRATLVVDSSRGVDSFGKVIIGDAQILFNAGSSVAQLERVIASDMRQNRKTFAFQIGYSSQIVGSDHRIEIDNILPVRAMLLGSFVTAHTELPVK